jgi:hypothetical protein
MNLKSAAGTPEKLPLPFGLHLDDDILLLRVATEQIVIKALDKRATIGIGHQTIDKAADFFPFGSAYCNICPFGCRGGRKSICVVVFIADGSMSTRILARLARPGASSPRSVKKGFRLHFID